MKNIFKYVILEQLLTENRIQQAKDKYPCVPPKLVDYLAAGDPSGNNKYLEWMCKQVWDSEGVNEIKTFGADGETKTLYRWLEDESEPGDYADDKEGVDRDPTRPPTCKEVYVRNLARGKSYNDVPVTYMFKELADTVIEEVKFFHRFVNALPIKDINRYNLNTLRDALTKKKLQAQEKEYAKNVNKLYEDEEWLLVSPKTHQASCAYGANTKWCVTMKNDPSYFQNYTEKDEYLIFVIDKTKNKKWAVHTKVPFGSPAEDVEINLPWHKEVKLHKGLTTDPFSSRDYSNVDYGEPEERRLRRGKSLAYLYKDDSDTTYWNAEDDNIGWDEFIKESKLPEKLQQLLRFLEKRFKVTVAKKKRGEIAYETNLNPVQLKKGDKVKLLASGYGYIRGDVGYVIKTYAGPLTIARWEDNQYVRSKKVTPGNAGVYTVYVPHRISQKQREYHEHQSGLTVKLKNGDKLIPKLDLRAGDDFKNTEGGVYIHGININGVYLQKI